MNYIIFQPVWQISQCSSSTSDHILTCPVSNLSVYLFTSVYLLVFICLSYCLYGYSFHFWLFKKNFLIYQSTFIYWYTYTTVCCRSIYSLYICQLFCDQNGWKNLHKDFLQVGYSTCFQDINFIIIYFSLTCWWAHEIFF